MANFLHLLCGIFLAVTLCHAVLMQTQQLLSVANEGFEGTTRSEFVLQRTKGTAIECQMQCLRDKECMSFFYNRHSGDCQTHGVVFFDSGDGELSPGSQYYRQVQDFCPSDLGYIYNRALDLCYKFHYLNPCYYNESREVCQTEGGDMVVLDTKEKLDHMDSTIIASTFPFVNWLAFYIGATDEGYAIQDWHWSDGQQVDQTTLNWCPYEPYWPGYERYIAIIYTPPNICLCDMDHNKNHFICERQI